MTTDAPTTTGEKARRYLISELKREGFDAVGVTGPEACAQLPDRLTRFLKDGHHATMGWMADTAERRARPAVLWPDVKSVVMAAMSYAPPDGIDPLADLEKRSSATISVYARNRDYHDVIKGKLKNAASRFAARHRADVKVFVDTAPVMEKPLAQAANLGWQGKHTNLVSRELGSWFFLGCIMTDLELPDDRPETDHCGSCRACLDICPTDAFPAPYRLDARRCISYLTIEHHGPIPVAFRAAMGNRIYGCDDCLAVCPWNKFAETASEAKLVARAELNSPQLKDLLMLDDAAFRQMFAGSPIKRIGRNRFMRNVLIAAGNSGDKTLIPPVNGRLRDPDATVRGAAVWAICRLMNRDEAAGLGNEMMPDETDASVREEWNAALQAPSAIDGIAT